VAIGPALTSPAAITDPSSRKFELYRMRPDGSDRQRWLKPNSDCAYGSRPTWNPKDPDQLAVSCLDENGREKGIWTVSADGTLESSLVVDEGVTAAPTWTDKDAIVFAVRRVGSGTETRTLARVPADGGPTEILDDRADLDRDMSYFDPDWGPGGLLFTGSRDYRGSGEILLRRGSEPARPWGSVTDSVYATWSPDGSAVAWLTPTGATDVPAGTAQYTLMMGEEDGKPLPGITGLLEPPAWGSR